MIDFRLDDEQMMLSQAVHRFAEERVRKVFREAEEAGKLPADVVQAGWEIGVLPTGLPEAYGGFGEYSAVTNVIAAEEFAWGDFATTLQILQPNLVALPVLLCGTTEQKEQYLPQFADAQPPKFTAAFTEPSIQFDPRMMRTTAVRDGEAYVLNGEKMMVPIATEADLFLVYANEAGTTQAFLVAAGAEGMTVGAREKLMGVNAYETYRVTFSDCRVPITKKLGGADGLDMSLILNHSRIALGAAAVGLARAGYEYAKEYAKQRVQFGEPIAHKQSIAFMLAEMAIDVDAARLLVWEAAWLLDQGKDATRECAVLKNHIDDLVVRVADCALQTLGGYGYIREYPVELWLRNARSIVHFDGAMIV